MKKYWTFLFFPIQTLLYGNDKTKNTVEISKQIYTNMLKSFLYGVKIIMDKESKKVFKKNVIKFVIGLVFLIMSYNYIQNHPAEKLSVTSGFKIMRERLVVEYHKLFKDDSSLIENKYNLEKYYTELLRMAEDKKCIDVSIISEINKKYKKIKSLSNKNLKIELPHYIDNAYKYEKIVKQPCD